MNVRRAVTLVVGGAGAAAVAVGVYGELAMGRCPAGESCWPTPGMAALGLVVGWNLVLFAGFGELALAVVLACLGVGAGSLLGWLIPGAGWGAPPFVVSLLIGIPAARAAKKQRRKAELIGEVRAHGLVGVGTVLTIEDLGTTVMDDYRVRLTLRIRPAGGVGSFRAVATHVVPRVAVPRPGDRYHVKYARNRRHVVVGDPVPPDPV